MKTPPFEYAPLPEDPLEDPLEAPFEATASPFRYFFLALVLFVAAPFGLIGLFGDNIRALFGASAGGLVGAEDRVVMVNRPQIHTEVPAGAYAARDLVTADLDRRRAGLPTPEERARMERERRAAQRSWHSEWDHGSPGGPDETWDRSHQSVWRYEYPPGDIWKVGD